MFQIVEAAWGIVARLVRKLAGEPISKMKLGQNHCHHQIYISLFWALWVREDVSRNSCGIYLLSLLTLVWVDTEVQVPSCH